MPDEHQIEPSKPEQTAQPEPPEQSEQQAPPDDAAPEQQSSPPDETPPDAGDEDVGDEDVGGDDADSRGVELDEVIRERDAHYDRLLRVTAEYDNFRRRSERERRELTEQATGDLLGDLLPVVDDLERALAADTEDGDAYRRGVEIIHKQLLDVMARRGVAPIEAVGTDFDPTLHQAVMHEPSDGHRDGEVVEELRRGYTLRQRLLRPSMVKVAKA
jgi:molecular chaperone GrpE